MEPRTVVINLEKKSKSKILNHETSIRNCPAKAIRPGDTVNWTSKRIKEGNKVEIKFTGDKHPFRELLPKLQGNIVADSVVAADAPTKYSYVISVASNGTSTPLGCGNLTPPTTPPGGGGGSGTSGTR